MASTKALGRTTNNEYTSTRKLRAPCPPDSMEQTKKVADENIPSLIIVDDEMQSLADSITMDGLPPPTRPKNYRLTGAQGQFRQLQREEFLTEAGEEEEEKRQEEQCNQEEEEDVKQETTRETMVKNYLFDQVREFFPDAKEARVHMLFKLGKSMQTVLAILADEARSHELPSSSPQGMSEGYSSPPARAALPSENQQACARQSPTEVPEQLLQHVLEVFPDADVNRATELLRTESLNTVMQVLAEESVDFAV
mmetsp:Transcript_22744/g.52616  ORF Transcript_22744/g.52616 Transcript_22744/m.52616 type:complete len:253 (-) Transcript_22744:149-907(-)